MLNFFWETRELPQIEDMFFHLNLVFVSQILFSRKAIESRKMEEKCFLSIKFFFWDSSCLPEIEDRFFHLNLIFVSQIVFSKKAIESRKMEEKCS